MKPYVMRVDQIGTGAIDFSYLMDAPAGKHGFVNAKDGHFYFDNGKQIRFFGVNLVFGAAMPDREIAVHIANRLAHSGMNMVRLHHVDSYQVGEHTDTLIDYRAGNSQKLHEENMDRLDYLFSLLKERGIYIHIDLFTLRRYLPAGDDLDYDDSLETALKHVNYYNRRLIELHKKFASQYLTHTNPYTGLRYVDDPAIAVVQILNENGIFWDNGEVPVPSYKRELDGRWNEWLLAEYKSRESLAAAWTKADGTQGLHAGEDPANGTVRRPRVGIWGERLIDHRADYSNLAGPARFADHVRFMTEIELGYIREMRTYLREIGVRCPINASNLPSGAAELRCIAEGDVTENNCYWNHPMGGFQVPVHFHTKEMVSSDPRDIDAGAFALNMITKLAVAKVEGKPFVVTEWNVCYPTKFRSDVILMLSSYAALQDWDGLLLFSYTHSGGKELITTDHMSGFFSSFNDPAVWGLAGLASAIFQEKLVHPARNLVEVGYTHLDTQNTPPHVLRPFGVVPYISRISARFLEEGVYQWDADAVLSSGFTATGNYTSANHALVYASSPYADAYQKVDDKAAFLRRHLPSGPTQILRDHSGAVIGEIGDDRAVIVQESVLDEDLGAFGRLFDASMKKWNLLSEDQGYDEPGSTLISDTGELTFRYGEGTFTVQTERLVAFAGLVRGPIQIGDVKLELHNRKASVSILTRDGKSLTESSHLLIAAVGESENLGMAWDGTFLVSEGTGPTMIDQISGQVFIPGHWASCRGYVLDQSGSRLQELPVEGVHGGYTVRLEHDAAAIYYEVVFE